MVIAACLGFSLPLTCVGQSSELAEPPVLPASTARPASMATKIVAPERDVPGKTPATTWAIPTRMATSQVMWALGGRRAGAERLRFCLSN